MSRINLIRSKVDRWDVVLMKREALAWAKALGAVGGGVIVLSLFLWGIFAVVTSFPWSPLAFCAAVFFFLAVKAVRDTYF